MAFDIDAAGGYGSGALGDVVNPIGRINHYALVGGIEGNNVIFLNNLSGDLDYTPWTVGTEIFLCCVRYRQGRDYCIEEAGYTADNLPRIGAWIFATITDVTQASQSLDLTLDKDITTVFDWGEGRPFDEGITIAVTVPHYHDLTLNSGCTLSPYPMSYDVNNDSDADFETGEGGILVLKCSGTLTLNGGHIDLRDKGHNVAGDFPGVQLREWLQYETNGTADIDKYSGWENSDTYRRFMLNQGDGAAFIIAKNLVVADNSSRIGNPNTQGVQFCRGASDSPNCPSGVTNIGGSTILICAETITDFNPAIIAKYRTTTSTAGKGLARCYIASETKLRNDEGLYSYDCISNPQRVSDTFNVKNFGDGSLGVVTNPTLPLNNYATVTAKDTANKVFTYTNKTTNGIAPLAIGALVMVHYNHKDTDATKWSGEFRLATIIGMTEDEITLDKSIMSHNLDAYNMQIISIPQFSKFTLDENYTGTPAYDGAQGGICAFACSGTCDLSGGKLNVEDKGGGRAYSRQGLNQIGNAQNCDKLPIGQGHGSVFILAKNLVMDADTRIGATHSGANFGGKFNPDCTLGGYRGSTNNGSGWGGGGGYVSNDSVQGGGYGSNIGGGVYVGGLDHTGKQGAHVMIIADKITGFNQAAISTGGSHDRAHYPNRNSGLASGGAGYGGAGDTDVGDNGKNDGNGGYNGGGAQVVLRFVSDTESSGAGGSSGWAFIYCNNAVNPDYTDVVND